MNQILSTAMPFEENKKKRVSANKKPVEIKSVLKFFAIALLVFGIFIIGTSIYSIYKNQSTNNVQNLDPTIAIEEKSYNSILLKITHKKNISKVEYYWNDEDSVVLNGSGKYLEKEITVPGGSNTLHVVVVDEDGNEITYDKQYEVESNINLDVVGNKIKISYDGDTTISYMTYRWDEEQEQKIEINDTSFEKEIEAEKGLHTLTVITVDVNNVTDTKVQKINGVSKPKVIVDVNDEKINFIIKASDDDKLTRIEFTLTNNGESKNYVLNLEEMDFKELNYKVPFELASGENIIEVKVYNSNNLTETVEQRQDI